MDFVVVIVKARGFCREELEVLTLKTQLEEVTDCPARQIRGFRRNQRLTELAAFAR